MGVDEEDFDPEWTEARRQSQDWRETHEEVLNRIRRDREMYKAKLNRQKLGQNEGEIIF
jgi:hypothetical protein